MRMRRLLCALVLASAIASAQEKQKIFEVKYADVNKLGNVLQTFNIALHAEPSLHVIAVRGTPELLATMEEMIKKLDVPPPNIELTVYLVSGSARPDGEELPQDLAPAVKQLRGLFSYKGYKMLDSFALRGRDGRGGSTNGVLPGNRSTYDFRYQSATVSAGTPRVVHLDNLQLNVRTPNGTDKDGKTVYLTAGVSTDIDAREGQKIVVGKSNINGSDDALILVVTAKVVE